MIDIHCHILPGLDDGPSTESEFLAMATAAVTAGVTDIYATPHHLNGQFVNMNNEIIESVHQANSLLKTEKIPLTLHPGQELRIHQDLLHSIEGNDILTLGNAGHYLLLELPSGEVPSYTMDVIYELLLKGLCPVIAHPERNRELLANPQLLYEMVLEGALTQLTTGSILGHFGKKIKGFSEKIIEHNLAHFVASDAHNVHTRGFSLQHALDCITTKYSIQHTYYFMENAQLLMEGNTINRVEPIQIRKRFLGVF